MNSGHSDLVNWVMGGFVAFQGLLAFMAKRIFMLERAKIIFEIEHASRAREDSMQMQIADNKSRIDMFHANRENDIRRIEKLEDTITTEIRRGFADLKEEMRK